MLEGARRKRPAVDLVSHNAFVSRLLSDMDTYVSAQLSLSGHIFRHRFVAGHTARRYTVTRKGGCPSAQNDRHGRWNVRKEPAKLSPLRGLRRCEVKSIGNRVTMSANCCASHNVWSP